MVFSTSTRNFPNRLGKDAQVYLGSAELAAVTAQLGRIPTRDEYLERVALLDTMAGEVYRYLNFNEIEEYQQQANTVKIPVVEA
jgi:aconitate hydratase 2/2-methylisocitrate dehydratase